jgi:hypothetical protein
MVRFPNSLRRRFGNSLNLVCWDSTGCDAGDPQNGRYELAWLLNWLKHAILFGMNFCFPAPSIGASHAGF